MLDKEQILLDAKRWFADSIMQNHIKNTKKLVDPKEFNINPFLTAYLANYLTGNATPESIARALVIPRVMSTSITTSFGSNIQNFTGILRDSFGSTTSGIDIEFVDHLDGDRKYCQLKAGPNTINKDDVDTIASHFKDVKNLAKTNNIKIARDDMIVGVIYGSPEDLSTHYKNITKKHDYPVIVGQEFWYRLTGDADFYSDLLQAIAEVAVEANGKDIVEGVIKELAKTPEIKALATD